MLSSVIILSWNSTSTKNLTSLLKSFSLDKNVNRHHLITGQAQLGKNVESWLIEQTFFFLQSSSLAKSCLIKLT